MRMLQSAIGDEAANLKLLRCPPVTSKVKSADAISAISAATKTSGLLRRSATASRTNHSVSPAETNERSRSTMSWTPTAFTAISRAPSSSKCSREAPTTRRPSSNQRNSRGRRLCSRGSDTLVWPSPSNAPSLWNSSATAVLRDAGSPCECAPPQPRTPRVKFCEMVRHARG